ncbi:MAG: hypothetical protein ACKVN9_09825 [Methylophilaceae bacterium]
MSMLSQGKTTLLLVMVALLAVMPVAHGAEKKDKAAKRMAQMMQKVQQEKAEMQAQFDKDKAALEEKAKKSEEETSKTKGSVAAANRKAKALATELEALKASSDKEKSELGAKLQQSETSLLQIRTSLEITQKNLADMTQQFQSSQRDNKQGEAQRKELVSNLTRKAQQVNVCQEKNAKLYDFGQQLVKVCDQPSAYEAAMRKEAFTQVKRVELENTLQEYRDKLDEQKLGALPIK